MAESYLDLGFSVEVVDCGNHLYEPPPDCRIAIDIHSHLERWDARLPKDCLRVLHATGPHWLQWNLAELRRLAAVRDRKGIALAPRRQAEPSRAVEVASQVTVLGNDYTLRSFAFGGKPVTRVPISSAYTFPWPEARDFETARRRFLWVGSYGMVHKGLDLVLDAFARLPHLELSVGGRPEKEQDFFALYRRELQTLPNIRFLGWLDMGTPEFLEVARTHAGIIYPSSAEGGAGSVIHAMHAGMVPIVTEAASIDTGDFGVCVSQATVEGVCEAVSHFASLSPSDVAVRARRSYEHARAYHTREQFRFNYARFAASLAESLT
jgi:glycosyltransferase involved in cell wall biosynthesis